MKTALYHSLTAGMLTSLACNIYNQAYSWALLTDFSAVINIGTILGASLLGCLLASSGFVLTKKFLPGSGERLFYSIFALLTCLSLLGAFTMKLPLDVASPELFIGLSAPMHLFPQLMWMATKPFFYK